MPYIGIHNKEVSFKIVYYGPGMSGKTTNLVHIHKSLRADRKGELVMLDTEEERTLFFDFFPLELGEVEGFSVRFNMYTVPGQSYYEASRKLVLDSADGVVFVADSQAERTSSLPTTSACGPTAPAITPVTMGRTSAPTSTSWGRVRPTSVGSRRRKPVPICFGF